MHRARAFFYVCAGVFLLALSYHLGARSAGAQAPGNPVVGISYGPNNYGQDRWSVATANGDVFVSNGGTWAPLPNVFSGATPAQRETFGALKNRYRGERGATQPTPQDK